MKKLYSFVVKFSMLALRVSSILLLPLVLLGPVAEGHASSPEVQVNNSIQVNTHLDVKQGNDGECSLREAIIAANSNKQSGGKKGECIAGSATDTDTILLSAGTYVLSRSDNGNEDSAETGDLDISGDLKIVGADSGGTVIDATGISDRAFHILSGNVEISGVTITKNRSFAGDGAGIYNSGHLTLNDSTIVGTEASGNGAAIYNAGSGSVALNNSTLSGNSATEGGGGIFNLGILELHNATIANNSGGDVVNSNPGSGTVNLRNTILGACSGTLTSQGYNLIQDTSGCTISGDTTGDIIGLDDPLLGPLEDNGGDTWTHALLPGSPAIDAGDPNGCFGSDGLLTSDQRGEPRPMDGNYDRDFRCDIGAYEVGESGLVLTKAKPDPDGTIITIDGRLASAANTPFTLEFFATDSCPSGFGPVDGATFLQPTPDPTQPIQVQTDEFGNVYFTATVEQPGATFVYGQATVVGGTTSEFSQCVPVGPGNDSWPDAYLIELAGDPPPPSGVVDDHYLDKEGQSRWYKFEVQPGSKVVVTLTGVDEFGNPAPLPANYDLALYKDIFATFYELAVPKDETDLVLLGAEFAADAFSADAFSADAFSADAFSADAFSADAFSADAFSADAFSADAFSADAFSADAFSADAFSADAFSADAFSADAFSADAFSADAFSADAFSADAFSADAFSADAFSADAFSAVFSSAQTRSLLGVSAFEGTAGEGLVANTWDNTGHFYVRVRGRNGAFSLDAPFRLSVTVTPGDCGGINFDSLPDASLTATDGGYETLILADFSRNRSIDPKTDLSRMGGTDAEKDALEALLNSDQFLNHPEVKGVVVDVGLDARVDAANALADANPECPFAKNQVAEAIKKIVDGYRDQNPLKYVVIVGGDEIIPFFRHPDNALLANEKNYFPPVDENTPSQASLRLGYVLSQDAYVSAFDVSSKNSNFPVPDPDPDRVVAVGRLVENAAEINTVLNAYLSTDGGVVRPQKALSIGYDFLEDASTAIAGQFEQGLIGFGTDPEVWVDTLIEDRDTAPENSWTAFPVDDGKNRPALSQKFLDVDGIDLAFLAGHFTANSWLAADYETRLVTEDLINSDVDLTNALIFSAGCHTGYNIVNQHGVLNVTREPDWAQAFARKGATVLAGTGYQYGDTDVLKYSEVFYLEFSKQLRLASSSGPISIGQAFVEAKKAYLAQTPQLSGLDEKALLEATIFGLPMLKVDLVRDYVPEEPSGQPEITLQPFPTGTPGGVLGLQFAEITVTPSFTEKREILKNVADDSEVEASYLVGDDGVVAKPAEPFLPLVQLDVFTDGTVLRGVGFWGGTYTEQDLVPLVSAATTELRGVHTPFSTDHFHPVQFWSVNYINALGSGQTLLNVTPAQHKAGPIVDGLELSTRRQFSDMHFILYYSGNVTNYGTDGNSIPGLSAPPSIIRVSAALSDPDTVAFTARVVGNPTAGIQEVWVTYTDTGASFPRTWQSLDLTQSLVDTTLWTGELDLSGTGTDPADLLYMVQAVNGVGLVGRADNLGLGFPVVDAPEPTVDTSFEYLSADPGTVRPYGTKVTFEAKLTSGGGGLADQIVTFRLGSQSRRAQTNASGVAQAELSLLGEPGVTEVRVSFAGAGDYKPSFATLPFTILEQDTRLTLNPNPASGPSGADKLVTAVLETVDGRTLGEKTVIFKVIGSGGSYSEAVVTTGIGGQAFLGNLPLPRGDYEVTASFDGTVNYTKTITDPVSLTLENNPPQVEDDAYRIDSFQLNVAAPGVLENDSDRDGDPLTAITATVPASGTLTLNPDGSFTYIPDASFDSLDDTDSFTYVTNDGFADSEVTATVTIWPSACFTARAVIDDPDHPDDPPPSSIWPPNGSDWTVHVEMDATEPISITGMFQDEPVGNNGPDGQILDHNTVEVRAERDGGGSGRVYHIFFTADDGLGGICQGQVRVPVVEHDSSGKINEFDEGALYDSTEAPKFAPVANDDPVQTDEDTPATGNVLDNDSDQNPHDILTVTQVNGDAGGVGSQITLPSGATLTMQPSGVFTYTPNGQFEFLAVGAWASDNFEYTVDDGNLGTDTATVTITISGVNDAPEAVDDSATVDGGGTVTTTLTGEVSVLANDSDVEGHNLSVDPTPVISPSHGSLTLNVDGTFAYTHDGGVATSDSFTYQVCDDGSPSQCDTAVVNISINPVNNAPVAVGDSATVDEGGTVTTLDTSEASVLANDSDPDGHNLSVDTTPVSSPSHGSLTLNADGTFAYTHDGGETTGDSFTYQVCDDGSPSLCNTVVVNISVNPVNDAPLAVDDSAAVDEGGTVTTTLTGEVSLLANDSDLEGHSLSVDPTTPVSGPSHGSLTLHADGTFAYAHDGGGATGDSFTYQVCDDGSPSLCDTAVVNISINPVNTPPVAVDDSASGTQGTPVTICVLANDEPDGDTLTVVGTSSPARGTVTATYAICPIGPPQSLVYTPNSNFRGTDEFTYTISDGRGGTDTATVVVTME